MNNRIDIMQDPSFRMGFNIIFDKISKLKKDNIELRGKNNEVVCKLTEAKEIIKYLLSFIQKENYRTRWDINIKQAEQFLNSEVEK